MPNNTKSVKLALIRPRVYGLMTRTLGVSHSRLWLKSNAIFSKLSKICAELRVIVIVKVQRTFFKAFKNLCWDGPSSPNRVELRVMVMVKALWLK